MSLSELKRLRQHDSSSKYLVPGICRFNCIKKFNLLCRLDPFCRITSDRNGCFSFVAKNFEPAKSTHRYDQNNFSRKNVWLFYASLGRFD